MLELNSILWSIFVIAITYAAYIPFYKTPLYQDQSLHFYIGKKWLEGKLPYRDHAFSMGPHFALIYTIGYLLCRNKEVLFNIYSVGVVALANVFLFLATKMLFGLTAGLIASGLFAIYSFSPRLIGDRMPPENYVNFPCTAALYFMLLGLKTFSPWCFGTSGACIATATLMRQTGYFYAPVLMLGAIIGGSISGASHFLAGFLIPHLFWIVYFAYKRCLKRYLNDTLRHIFFVVFFGNTEGPGRSSTDPMRIGGWQAFWTIATNSYTILPVYVAATGLVVYQLLGDRSVHVLVVALMFISGLYLITPRRNFDCCYWLNTVPWAAMLAGALMGRAVDIWPDLDLFVKCLLISLGLGYVFYVSMADHKLYSTFDPQKRNLLFDKQKVNHASWWPTFNVIGKYLEENTRKEDKVLVIGHAARIHNISGRDAFFFVVSHVPFKQKTRNRRLYDDFYAKMKVDYPKVIVLAGHMPAFPFNVKPYLEDMADIQRKSGIVYTVKKGIDNFPIYFADIEKSYISALVRGCFLNERLEREKEKISDVTIRFEKELMKGGRERALIEFGKQLKADQRFDDVIHMVRETGAGGWGLSSKGASEILLLAGEAQFEKGDVENAEKTFLRVIRVQPDAFEAYNNLGVTYFKMGRHSEASKMFDHVLTRDPHNADARANMLAAEAQLSTL